MSSPIKNFKERLHNNELILFDGALGTELFRRGVPTTLPLWSASALYTNPDIVEEIHLDYCMAGASVITTNTFRTNVRTLKNNPDGHDSRSLTLKACELAHCARERSGKEIVLGGCIAPIEDCYQVELVPPLQELREEHALHASFLAEGRVDFALIETMNCIREALAACQGAVDAQLPFGVSFLGTNEGKLLSGETFVEALKAIRPLSPLFVGVNCVPPRQITPSLDALSEAAAGLPLAVYANGVGSPSNDDGWNFVQQKGVAEREYTEQAKSWYNKGFRLIGGCCGTTPAYIRALHEQFRE